jgi:hypothetical protein
LLHYYPSLIHFENAAVGSQSQKIIRLFHYSFHVSGCVRILSKIAITKKQTIEKRKNLNLLNTVSFENGFHFFTELGKYTGITASSIVEFAEKLQIIPIQSVTFHFQRQDFQKWLKNTIGDEELAKRIDQIKAGSQDENLRKELSKTVQNRITELTKSSQQISS